jgi:hypothetical protein
MNSRRRSGPILLAIAGVFLTGLPRSADAQPGPYIASNGRRDFSGPSFRFAKPADGVNVSDYVAATYYFYWYDDTPTFTKFRTRGQNLFTPFTETPYDVLGLHPTYVEPRPIPPEGVKARPWGTVKTPPQFSYADVGWHRRELEQIAGAGLDLVLADYWGLGDDADAESWSNVGLVNLDKAAAGLGRGCPRIALFYDTNTLFGANPPQLNFDSSPAGLANKRAFYRTIRDFYSRVAPVRWGRFNGAAVVWLYTSNATINNRPTFFGSDGSLFDYCRSRFAEDFGNTGLFFVGDIGWAALKPIGLEVDMVYAWGAATAPDHVLSATRYPVFDVNQVGAQFDHSANIAVQLAWQDYKGQAAGPPSRCDAETFRRAWREANSGTRRVVAVETWNELIESSGILPSVEFGTMYYDITRQGVNTLHFHGEIVRRAYAYQLGRAADGGGYGRHTASLDDRSLSPSQLRDNLVNSPEAAARTPESTYLQFLYQRYLRRDPTDQDLGLWSGNFRSGRFNRSTARDAIVSSAEAQVATPDRDFVNALFAQFLNRAPDLPGRELYLKALARGVPRSKLIDQFLNSDEFARQNLSSRNPTVQSMRIFDFAGY